MYALTKEAYRRKIQARLGLAHAQAKLNELKEKNKTSSANPVGEYSNEINELEKNIEETQKRLNELYAANGQVGFLGSQRVDGKMILPEAVKVLVQKAGSAG